MYQNLLVVLTLVTVTFGGSITTKLDLSHSHRIEFDEGRFIVDHYLAKDEKSIMFQVEAEAPGWISIGFTKDGGMTNADIVVGEINDDDTVNIRDFFSEGHGMPTLDKDQNKLTEKKGKVTKKGDKQIVSMEFRKLVKSGLDGDIDIPLNGVEVIWAYGKTKKLDGKHAERGSSKEKVEFAHAHGGSGALSLEVPFFAILTLGSIVRIIGL